MGNVRLTGAVRPNLSPAGPAAGHPLRSGPESTEGGKATHGFPASFYFGQASPPLRRIGGGQAAPENVRALPFLS